ncbi:MAG: glycosyltransferase family 2 protein [Candidatus Omnitrophica bacterium]|nr:glycosyltransferase family 2 protein [Candidatus Omnitrophota bacterium]
MPTEPGTPGNGTACDIIVPIWNQPELTRRCLQRVLCSTQTPYRLILIDNGSEIQTQKFLTDFAKEHPEKTLRVRNEQNLGFIKATNQGLRASGAPYACLLNNDTVVAKGWLEEMIRIAESDSSIGLVNANSNTFGQKPSSARIEGIEACARSLHGQRGQIRELATAVGFCLLIRRSVIQAVGFLDEAFGMGNFEDADFSQRARVAGYRSVLALGAYVYHEEKVSFKRRPGWEEDFDRNRRIYHRRWGKPLRIFWEEHRADAAEAWIPTLTRWAAQGHWITCSANVKKESRAVLERHAAIRFMQNNGGWKKRGLWYLLRRRKKPVDVAVIHDPQFKRWVSRLRFGHGAAILYQPTPSEAQEQCQRMSRCL